MCGRSAHEEAPDGRAVVGPSGRRPEEEQLLECQFALEDVAFRQTERAFDVQRREDLPVQYQVLQVRGVLGNRVDDRVTERLTMLIPLRSIHDGWVAGFLAQVERR